MGGAPIELGPLPLLTEENRPFWEGGERGKLTMLRCQACAFYIHPPSARCPRCHSAGIAPADLSGRGTVYSYTVSHIAWFPGLEAPYVVAVVELPEQAGLRLSSRMVGCAPEEVAIGMPVRVVFEKAADIWRPVFEPDGEGEASNAG
jgi:uncharacterized OB-fold protein